MKTHITNPVLLAAFTGAIALAMAGQAAAQTLTTLYSFTALDASSCSLNSDGANPTQLILSGNTLYGTASFGGPTGDGTVFAVNTDGTGFGVLYTFSAINPNTNSDGAIPFFGLALGGSALYGSAFHGGPAGAGTVFGINTDGTDFNVIHAFTPPASNGASPAAGMLLVGNTLYGTTYQGGSVGAGTVFKVNTDGTGFTSLHSFSTLNNPGGTNSDGGNPEGYLILSGNSLYGTTHSGGRAADGVIFKVNTDGTGFTNLHSFGTLVKGTNTDGIIPGPELLLSGSVLYGTAGGGKFRDGVIFKVNTNGTGFATLYNFTSRVGFPGTNSDGAGPGCPLVLSGDMLIGAAGDGGSSGAGTLFALSTNGTGFTTLYNFSGGSDGANPFGGLILSGDTLYGTTYNGGDFGSGNVFSFSLAP